MALGKSAALIVCRPFPLFMAAARWMHSDPPKRKPRAPMASATTKGWARSRPIAQQVLLWRVYKTLLKNPERLSNRPGLVKGTGYGVSTAINLAKIVRRKILKDEQATGSQGGSRPYPGKVFRIIEAAAKNAVRRGQALRLLELIKSIGRAGFAVGAPGIIFNIKRIPGASGVTIDSTGVPNAASVGWALSYLESRGIIAKPLRNTKTAGNTQARRGIFRKPR
mgnify:CR=1 FL=1